MTSKGLADGYFQKCCDRLAALKVLMERDARSDVIRESQEVVELALKGMLRAVGIDPPKLHDVGALVVEAAARFSSVSTDQIQRLAEGSLYLRKEREFSFYGDIDLIPTKLYSREDAARALAYARSAADALASVLGKTIV